MRNRVPLAVFLVEDNPGDARLIQEHFRSLNADQPSVEWAHSQEEEALAEIPRVDPDAILLDMGLPDASGLEGLSRINSRMPTAPVIIPTGSDDQEVALTVVSGGAHDSLLKAEVNGPALQRLVRYALERMASWKDLQASEAKYQDLYENAPEMLASVDPETGTILECNATLADAVGWEKEALVGAPALDLYLPSCRRSAEAALAPSPARCPVMGEELESRTRDEGTIPVSLSVSDHFDQEGRLLFSRWSLRDISRRKEADEELRALNLSLEEKVSARTEELKAVVKELEAFAYSVSHDLRGPLRAIDGFGRILEEEYATELDEEGLRLLGLVRENTRRMGTLIDDLLEFSRAGRRAIRPVDLDMGAMVRSVAEELQSKGALSGVELSVGPLPSARGDLSLVRQVWVNLLSNAFKFTRHREEPRVEVKGWLEGGQAVYRVRDNGAGFDMAFADKLFAVFERLHRVEEFEGTGVGLALARRIADRHGGRIQGEGEVDMGASFTFSLPTSKEELP